MDTGRIFIGIACVMLAVALLVTPTSAVKVDVPCKVGNGSVISSENMGVPYISHEPDETTSPHAYATRPNMRLLPDTACPAYPHVYLL